MIKYEVTSVRLPDGSIQTHYFQANETIVADTPTDELGRKVKELNEELIRGHGLTRAVTTFQGSVE